MNIGENNRKTLHNLSKVEWKMVGNKPRLSIGLPVFNGEKYLRQAIDSILIISDNGSTDRTGEICREYLKDDRVHYYRSEKNHGLAWNLNRVFELSSGVYFKWAAHDDMMASEFLSKCISVLEKDPAIVLCHSKNAIIDETGEVVGTYRLGTIMDSKKPHERFSEMLNRKGFPWLIFGVFRRDALSMTQIFGGYIGSDWNLLAEISLIGRIVEIPEYLFFRREHPQAYTNRHYSKPVRVHDYRTETLWLTGRKRKALIVLPHWRNCIEFFKSVRHVPLTWSERWLCYREITRWFLGKGKGWMKWDFSNVFELWWSGLNSRQTRKGQLNESRS
jgi:glycosyltransferase involved in cell wall biosynthesis